MDTGLLLYAAIIIVAIFITFAVIRKIIRIIHAISVFIISAIVIVAVFAIIDTQMLQQQLAKEDKILVYNDIGIKVSDDGYDTLSKEALSAISNNIPSNTRILYFNDNSFSDIKTVTFEGKEVDAAVFKDALQGKPSELLKLLNVKGGEADDVHALALVTLVNELLKSNMLQLIAKNKLAIAPETTTFKIAKALPQLW